MVCGGGTERVWDKQGLRLILPHPWPLSLGERGAISGIPRISFQGQGLLGREWQREEEWNVDHAEGADRGGFLEYEIATFTQGNWISSQGNAGPNMSRHASLCEAVSLC